MRIPSLLLLVTLAACANPKPPQTPVEWRGHTYTACQDRVARAKQVEAEGVPSTRPTNGAERQRLLTYITDTELLSFGEPCGRGGTEAGGSIGFLGMIASDVPQDVEVQGDLAVDLYQDMLLHRHSAAFIRQYIDDGRFEEHMKLRRLAG